MAVGSLWSHLKTQHDIYTSFATSLDAAPPVAPRRLTSTYNIKEGKYRCTIPGCLQGHEGGDAKHPSTSDGTPGTNTPRTRW